MNIPEGQLSEKERIFLYEIVKEKKPKLILESGTWKGGGSTLFITKSLFDNGFGVLHTYEEHTGFYEIAKNFYDNIELKNNIILHNKSIIDGLKELDDEFFQRIELIFLDGGDELPSGQLKRDSNDYIENYNLSENVESFKFLFDRIKIGTTILLHDWYPENGRGNWIKRYLEDINYKNIKLIEVIDGSTGLAHLIKEG